MNMRSLKSVIFLTTATAIVVGAVWAYSDYIITNRDNVLVIGEFDANLQLMTTNRATIGYDPTAPIPASVPMSVDDMRVDGLSLIELNDKLTERMFLEVKDEEGLVDFMPGMSYIRPVIVANEGTVPNNYELIFNFDNGDYSQLGDYLYIHVTKMDTLTIDIVNNDRSQEFTVVSQDMHNADGEVTIAETSIASGMCDIYYIEIGLKYETPAIYKNARVSVDVVLIPEIVNIDDSVTSDTTSSDTSSDTASSGTSSDTSSDTTSSGTSSDTSSDTASNDTSSDTASSGTSSDTSSDTASSGTSSDTSSDTTSSGIITYTDFQTINTSGYDLTGQGSESSPFEINSVEEFVIFASYANNASEHYILNATIENLENVPTLQNLKGTLTFANGVQIKNIKHATFFVGKNPFGADMVLYSHTGLIIGDSDYDTYFVDIT